MAHHHPGKTLLEQYLGPRKLSQNALARAIGVPPRRINEIILGKRAITADTAVRLGVYFGNSPGDWMLLQTEYDIALAREKIGLRLNMIKLPDQDEDTPPVPEAESGLRYKSSVTNPQQRNIRKRIMR